MYSLQIFYLYLQIPFLGEVKVADVLADRRKFENKNLADPLRGPEEGAQKAIFRVNPNGKLWIDSFSHGRTKYTFEANKENTETLPLFSPMGKSEPHPIDALGPILGPAASAIANRAQIAPAIAAQSVLATASLVASSCADVASTWEGGSTVFHCLCISGHSLSPVFEKQQRINMLVLRL